MARTEWHQSLENAWSDRWHVLAGVRYEPRHTAFISVDDATLLAYKDDPLAFWAPYWAAAMQTLTAAGVKAVGFDFIYQVSAESWLRKLKLPNSAVSRTYDAPLRAALASGDKILITHLVELPGGDMELLAPPADQLLLLPGGASDLGIANLHPDADKRIRSFFPVMIPDPAVPGLAFNLQLALRAAGLDADAQEWRIGGTTLQRELKRYRIGYAGPPGTIPTVSMLTLLQPDALERPEVKALKGRVAIIGANNVGAHDRHFTPYGEQMAGAEVHANIVETILSGRYLRPLPVPLGFAYLAVMLGIAAWLFLRLAAWQGLAAGLALAALAAALGYAAFQREWIVPVAEVQSGLMAGFLMTLGLRLTGEERERARIRAMFGRYVSDDVVDKLLGEEHRPDLGGETLTVTVLFSDIRGFTTISEKLSAHEVVEMLNAYFTRVCEPILAEGGSVDKFVGDAVMAVFGSPAPYPDHARRALRAALGMAREAEAFSRWMEQRFPGRDLPPFGAGVGLATGEVVIGDIGTPKRKDFTAIGDTVNAASRLEGLTKDMNCAILASEATIRAAGAGVRTGRVQSVTVRGRNEPIVVYEVLGVNENS